MKISVVGVGRVGLSLAVMLSKFYPTVGIDINQKAVDRVNSGGSFTEPLVDEYLLRYGLRATTDFKEIEESDFIFVCVGSQTPGMGYASDRFLSALRTTLPYLNSPKQLLVITSTLPPRELNARVLPYLIKAEVQKRILGFCYNPTMVALGRAVTDFEKPPYTLIGESNEIAGQTLEAFWKKTLGNDIKVFRGTILDAAVAKYALNTALVSKISLLSFLTELCEKEGSDVDRITEILRADPRLAGSRMFKGGLGYGGTCFPADVEAVRYECKNLGIPTVYPDALTSVNNWQVERTVALLSSFGKKRIAVLGLSFKQGTDVIVSSQPLQIAQKLVENSLEVMVYDPRALSAAKEQLGSLVRYALNVDEAINFAGVVFIAVEWPEFVDLKGSSFKKEQVVVDPWRILRSNPPLCTYVPYGLGRTR